jgi:hypothetical protein
VSSGTSSSGSAHGSVETISAATKPRLELVIVTVRSVANMRVNWRQPSQPSLSEMAAPISATQMIALAWAPISTAMASRGPQAVPWGASS